MDSFVIACFDPGTDESAVVLYDCIKNKVVDHFMLENYFILDKIPYLNADRLACEMFAPYLGLGQETLDACLWAGRFIQRWLDLGKDKQSYSTIFRREVTKALEVKPTKGKSTDGLVRKAVISIVGEPGTKAKPGPTYGLVEDEWQALAVGIADYRMNLEPSLYMQNLKGKLDTYEADPLMFPA